jgi:hypothetical protein
VTLYSIKERCEAEIAHLDRRGDLPRKPLKKATPLGVALIIMPAFCLKP